jgi:hypothetical protein
LVTSRMRIWQNQIHKPTMHSWVFSFYWNYFALLLVSWDFSGNGQCCRTDLPISFDRSPRSLENWHILTSDLR